MPEVLDRPTVLRLLDELDRRDPRREVFGSGSHDYKLNPPLPVSVIEAFEGRHGVSLPEDYRLFITEVGDGGAGPYYGLLPFGKDDDDRDWEGGGLVGDPGRPFPHTTAWNLPDSFWAGEPDWPPDTPIEEQDRMMDAWDRELERTTGTRRSWTGRSRSATRAVRCGNGSSSTASGGGPSGMTTEPTTPGSHRSWASRASR